MNKYHLFGRVDELLFAKDDNDVVKMVNSKNWWYKTEYGIHRGWHILLKLKI